MAKSNIEKLLLYWIFSKNETQKNVTLHTHLYHPCLRAKEEENGEKKKKKKN